MFLTLSGRMRILKDKVAIITGASRGIGFAIAKEFEQAGARLVLTARANVQRLEVFRNALRLGLNLASQRDVGMVVASAIKRFDHIDILINNAGLFEQKDFGQISHADLEQIFAVNFFGAFSLAQEVFAHMKGRKTGKIINLTSGAGILGSSRAAHYASAKAALIGFTKSLAKLAGPHQINVNAIAPGFIETDMIKDVLLRRREECVSLIPLRRIGSASDVAKLALFLASSEYITGQVISVDGGQCM